MFRRRVIENTHIFMHTHRQNVSVVSTDYHHKTKTSCMNQWDGLMPQQAMDGGAIDIFTWGCDSLVKEPSTPGNELPAWYISLTGGDCSGATWYCNSSNSLISHFSSITLPWHAEKSVTHIHQLSVNLSTCLKSNCHVATAGCSSTFFFKMLYLWSQIESLGFWGLSLHNAIADL